MNTRQIKIAGFVVITLAICWMSLSIPQHRFMCETASKDDLLSYFFANTKTDFDNGENSSCLSYTNLDGHAYRVTFYSKNPIRLIDEWTYQKGEGVPSADLLPKAVSNGGRSWLDDFGDDVAARQSMQVDNDLEYWTRSNRAGRDTLVHNKKTKLWLLYTNQDHNLAQKHPKFHKADSQPAKS